MQNKIFITEHGSPYPPGSTPTADGINFALFSKYATGVELLLFNRESDIEPVAVIYLDPEVNKTFFFWHIYLM